ncbi:hypothetical protein [Sphingobacterium sp. LRF_L2]|uniref:hypothetical protein n=1 Tax=Sphingobacterium sp. LRF_L2 TaxID=3369421 RepID=UPI003F60E854
MNIGDKYVLKALDSYPFYLEETLESLSYALSYDDANTMALNLMGRVYAEQLYNYDKAKEYFQTALSENVFAVEVYPYFIQLLLDTESFEEAEKTIAFALTVRGINKAAILLKQLLLLEKQQKYRRALMVWKDLSLTSGHYDIDIDLKAIEERIKQKQLLKKKKAVKKKTK